MAEVILNSVIKSFGKTEIIHGVDLQIKEGEFVVFVGPSGCGKSTLLRMVAGLEEVTSGEIHIGGRMVNDVPPAERGIAMVFQSYALYPHMNVEENMGFGLKLARVPKTEIKRRVLAAAKILQLEPLLERKPKALSGGQRQRVAIGRSIVTEPQVFLFDEPLSNLDAALRVQMRIEITKLHKQLATTIIYVTHDQVEAMTMADRIVVLSEGYVEQFGPAMELYQHPQNLFVAGFIGSPKMNFIEGKLTQIDKEQAVVGIQGRNITAAVDAKRAEVGDKVMLGIRPEHMTLDAHSSTAGAIEGEVLLVEHLGDQTLTYMQSDGASENIILREEGESTAVKVGDNIKVAVPPHQCYLFDADGAAFPRLPLA